MVHATHVTAAVTTAADRKVAARLQRQTGINVVHQNVSWIPVQAGIRIDDVHEIWRRCPRMPLVWRRW